jgi:hypothetical protein
MSINSQKIKNNNIYTFPNGKDLPREESWLYSLLLDHPFFINEVKKIRVKLDMPEDGFKGYQDFIKWGRLDKKVFLKECEKLVDKFKIPNNLIIKCRFFVSDYIISKGLIEYLLPKYSEEKKKLKAGYAKKKKPGAAIVVADRNREINKFRFTPNNIYLEIYPDTTARDILSIFKKISKKRKIKQKHNISQPDIINKDVWNLTGKLKNDTEIALEINKRYGTEFGYDNISVYRKRYKDALNKLRHF